VQIKEHHHVDVSSERGFGLVFCVVFALVFLWPIVFGDGDIRIWAAIVSASFLAISYIKPLLFKPFNKAWFAFGLLLGKIVAPIVMMVVYAVTVVPTGVIMRALGKDLLATKKPSADQKTFWIARDTSQERSMNNQF
jgi:predicted membrane metal-binding protein